MGLAFKNYALDGFDYAFREVPIAIFSYSDHGVVSIICTGTTEDPPAARRLMVDVYHGTGQNETIMKISNSC